MLGRKLLRRFSEILCDLQCESGGLRVISLQNPSKKNALSSLLIRQMIENLQKISDDPESRCVIIRSKVENAFCTGADLKERASMSQADTEKFVSKLRSTFNMIEDLTIPTIACIEGYALGGGLEMALACDLRYGSPSAKIGLVETSIAVIPGAGGTYRLPKVVGLQKAKEMVFTAGIYSAEDAKKFGIFNDVASDAYVKCLEVAASIGKNGPVAVRMAKQAMNLGFGQDRGTGMDIESLCYAKIVGTQDRIEGLLAFKEKRKPVFKGN